MKKNFFLTMLAAFCLAACTETKTTTEIKVTGDLGDPKPTYLTAFGTGDSLMQAQSVEDSLVTFVVDSTEAIFVVIDRSSVSGYDTQVCTVIADGTPVEVTLKDGESEITKGSEQNMKLQEGRNQIKALNLKFDNLREEYGKLREKYGEDIPQELEEDLDKRWDAIDAEIKEAYKQIIQENADNLVPIYFLNKYANDLGLEFTDSFLTSYKYKDSKMLERTYKIISGEKNKQEGAEVVDFEAKDISGKECHLTDFVGKGKYVLVDFWASWCGPCKAEIPNIKANYEKYQQKGFEVVGVSLDYSHEDWEKCVQNLGITWPQVTDMENGKSPGAILYNVQYIPTTILYGPDGKVIKAYLHGEALGQKLAEIFGE